MTLKLKEFVVNATDADTAILKCPRKSCSGVFVVDRGKFREGVNLAATTKTRPCPYCFRVSLVPTSAPVS